MTGKRIAIIIVAVLTVFAQFGCAKKEYSTLTRTVFSSGIVFSASVCGGESEKALEKMSAVIDEIGASVNAEDENSYVSRFNQAGANENVEVDEHTYFLAVEAKRLYEQTEGAFNVALSPLSSAWGVDVKGINAYAYTGSQPSELPSLAEIETLKESANLSLLTAKEEDGKYYLTKSNPSLTLDLGGIAKGYCTDVCRDVAKEYKVTSALIQLSGNLFLIGENENSKTEQKKWGVGVNNPRAENSDRYVCGFYDGDCGIATSGDYERFYSYGYESGRKVKVCHIIDGSSGMPVGVEYDEQNGEYKNASEYVISATVKGESSMLCDVYATAVCVLGLEKGRALLKSVGYEAIIFTSNKKCSIVGEFELDESVNLYKTEYQLV